MRLTSGLESGIRSEFTATGLHDYIFIKGLRRSIYDSDIKYLDILVFFKKYIPWLRFSSSDLEDIGCGSLDEKNLNKQQLYQQLIEVVTIENNPYRFDARHLGEELPEVNSEPKH